MNFWMLAFAISLLLNIFFCGRALSYWKRLREISLFMALSELLKDKDFVEAFQRTVDKK